MFTFNDHTFSVCAYGDSPYLEDCIKSLLSQTRKSEILLATSTPSDRINAVAEKYKIKLYVNDKQKGIAADWNFATQCAETKLVTIAHQDDIYAPTYLEETISALNNCKDALIAFSDYGEIKNGKIIGNSPFLKVKSFMLFPLKFSLLSNKRFFKRFSIAFGNPICCPSVTYVKSKLPNPLFCNGFRSNLDWDAWERFSCLKGSFVYVPSKTIYHRIHEGSETSFCIVDSIRFQEDYDMLTRFWPCPVAKLINKLYVKAQDSNEV